MDATIAEKKHGDDFAGHEEGLGKSIEPLTEFTNITYHRSSNSRMVIL